MRDLSKAECDALEALIDGCDIAPVLRALANICGGKAVRFAVNLQDTAVAKKWMTLEGAISMVVSRAKEL